MPKHVNKDLLKMSVLRLVLVTLHGQFTIDPEQDKQ
jgi:hypothetical protein